MRSSPAPAIPALLSALLLFLGPAGGRPAAAGSIRIDTDDPSGRISFGGDGYNLPVGPTVTSAQAIAAALQLPQTRAAMERFDARGYLRRAASDTTVFSFGNPPLTLVILAYHKPGLTPGPNHIGAPLILAATSLLPTGEPTTACTAGISVVDTLNRVCFSGDSLASLAATDPSFDVALTSGGNDEPLRRPVIRTSATPYSGMSKFTRFALCAGLAANLCTFRMVLGLQSGIGLFLAVTAPEAIVAAIEACAGYAIVTCLVSQIILQ